MEGFIAPFIGLIHVRLGLPGSEFNLIAVNNSFFCLFIVSVLVEEGVHTFAVQAVTAGIKHLSQTAGA